MSSPPKLRDRSKLIDLSSHDVNVISAIVQQKDSLPRNFLLSQAKNSNISRDALEIIEILLDKSFAPRGGNEVAGEATTKNATKKIIADEFYRWARATKSF